MAAWHGLAPSYKTTTLMMNVMNTWKFSSSTGHLGVWSLVLGKVVKNHEVPLSPQEGSFIEAYIDEVREPQPQPFSSSIAPFQKNAESMH